MTVGTITVDLLAKTGSFETDLQRAERQAAKSAKSIDKSFTDAGKAVGAGLAVAVTAAVALANNAIDSLAELDDAAQKTGSSVENLSRLQQVGEAFGQDFGTVSDALSKLAKGMASVDDETNKTNKALAALGLSSKDAAGKLRDPSEVLEEVAKGLQDYEDGAAKAALVTDLFGKAGANLLPYLNDLAESGERFTGVTKEAAAEAAKFQDNLGLLKTEFLSLVRGLTGDVLPALNKFIETVNIARKTSIVGALFTGGDEMANPGARIAEITKQLDNLNRQRADFDKANPLAKMFSGEDAKILDGQIAALQKQKQFLQGVQQQQALALQGTDKLDRMASGGGSKVLDYTTGNEKKDKSGAKEKQSEADRYLDSLKNQVITVQNLTAAEEALDKIRSGSLGNVSQQQQDQILAAATMVDLMKDQIEVEKQRQKLLDEGKKIYEDTRTPIEKLNNEILRLNELLDAGSIDWDTYARATFAAQDAFDKLSEKATETKGELDVFAETAARNIQTAFADFLFDPLEGGFSGMAKSFANTLRRMAADAVAADLARMLFGQTSSGKSSDGQGLFGLAFSALSAYLTGGPGRAAGGPVTAGMPYTVGENGRETFIPNTNGTIVPASMSQGASGGNVVFNQTNNIDSRSDLASVQAAVKQASDNAVTRIKYEMRIGGQMARLTGTAN